jgi:hypothetical protein
MDTLDGIWRLVDSRAWSETTERLSTPYGACPMGTIVFAHGRMLAALCNGDRDDPPVGRRAYSSYGGPYTFDGTTLTTTVDMASDAERIGSSQVRTVVVVSDHEILLRPPTRLYDGAVERRELVWERVWQPDAVSTQSSVICNARSQA